MFPRLVWLQFLFAVSAGWAAEDAGLPPAAPPYYRVRYEAGTQPGELVYGVTYTIWIPPGVQTLRGVIVHQHGCGEGASHNGRTAAYDLYWQELARRHECALLGPNFEQPEKANCTYWCDPRYGSGKRLEQALADLGRACGHPELATVPWALWGHSGGATWAGTMLLLHPERIVAVWLRSGWPHTNVNAEPVLPQLEIPEAALQVPVMMNVGVKEKDDRFKAVWSGGLPWYQAFRARGALAGFAPDPRTSHECGDSRYLAVPFFDACLTARLPKDSGATLPPMPVERAWLAPLLGDTPVPAASCQGEVKEAVWLPDEAVAKAWSEYVKTGETTDTTPPPVPTDLHLSEGKLSWEARADFESGLGQFIIERDGKELARLPEKPQGRFGRPLFQGESHGDTPDNPLAVMIYTDATAAAGEAHDYRVRAVNSVGLVSEPSVPVSSGP